MCATNHIYWTEFSIPCGKCFIASSNKGITQILISKKKDSESKNKKIEIHWLHKKTPLLEKAKRQILEYFSGQRKKFDVTLDLKGTDFQLTVWKALQNIPYGKTCCYKDIARHIRRPKAMRAVGNANHNNPIPIIIPCHRVIGKNGTLVGFAGGLPLKKHLLELEQTKN